MNVLEHTSFPQLAERLSALYREEDDALLLCMLGQEYVVRRDGIYLRGQRAPETHSGVILDYLRSSGTTCSLTPWRAIGDFAETAAVEFRNSVEMPISVCSSELVTRASVLLPMVDAIPAKSLVNSDLAFTVRALPKVCLHVELSQETPEFPAEAWVLFSNNAHEFLAVSSLRTLAEVFKDRLLSLIRIY